MIPTPREGVYQNLCRACLQTFYGGKRDCICSECEATAQATLSPEAKARADARHRRLRAILDRGGDPWSDG